MEVLLVAVMACVLGTPTVADGKLYHRERGQLWEGHASATSSSIFHQCKIPALNSAVYVNLFQCHIES